MDLKIKLFFYFYNNIMDQLGLKNITRDMIIKNIGNISFSNYFFPLGVKGENAGSTLQKIAVVMKNKGINNFIAALTERGFFDAGKKETIQQFFFYIQEYTAMDVAERVRNTMKNLEQCVRDAFMMDKSLLHIENFYIYIDNFDKTDEDVKIESAGIFKSKKLRAIKLTLLKQFYSDLIKFFLNMLMDMYYNINTMEMQGERLENCAHSCADFCYDIKYRFEKEIILEEFDQKEVEKEINQQLDLKQPKVTHDTGETTKPKKRNVKPPKDKLGIIEK